MATVSFLPPASNGSRAITGYTVTSNPGGITVKSAVSPITVTGLINGTTYTFTVAATNKIGTGPPSSPSNSVTPAPAAVNWPLRVSANGPYLEDQNGVPFLVVGDTAWSLDVALQQSDVVTYLNDRQAKGFTAIIVNAIEHKFCANPPADAYGYVPFTNGENDWSVRNENYWSNLDFFLNQAKARGILVVLAPAYFGSGGGDEGWYVNMAAQSDAAMTSYGNWVGTRYANQGNILWLNAVDAQCNQYTNGCARVNDIASAIQSVGAVGSLQTAESHGGRQAMDDYDSQSWLTINGVYPRCDNIDAEVQSAYQRSGALPIIVTESGYEYGGTMKCSEGMTLTIVQHEAMVSYLGGALVGDMYGNASIWGFGYGLQQPYPWNGANGIGSPGSFSMSYIGMLLRSREWWKLVPDYANAVVTSSKGSELSYKATARTSDGKTIMVWNPDTTNLPITVDMTKITGTRATVNQWNPTDNTWTSLGVYETTGTANFSPSAGTVLVIDKAS